MEPRIGYYTVLAPYGSEGALLGLVSDGIGVLANLLVEVSEVLPLHSGIGKERSIDTLYNSLMKDTLMDMADIPTKQSELEVDKPITSHDQDFYGWGAYADNLAQALSQVSSEEGLVVGIEGPWGAGKTSLKNLLIEKLNPEDSTKQQKESKKPATRQDNTEDSTKPIPVVEFEPWMFSGSDRLVSLMFKQISQSLSGWRNTAIDVAAHGSKQIAKTTGAASRAVRIVSPTVADSLSLISEGFEEVGESLEPDGHDIDKLSKRRGRLVEQLEQSPTRIIVFIDDLDRLMDDEVVDILRAVKAVGDLPNVTYVLLYDRTVISKALDKSCHDKGAEYLEKIIQVPVGLPKPPDDAVQGKLKEELNKIIGEEAHEIYEIFLIDLSDSKREVYANCVLPFIHNIRDVTRLSNEFGLRYRLLQDDVELRDLLGITTLETFRPDLHRWIMGNKRLLCSPSEDEIRYRRDDVDDRAKDLKAQLDNFFSQSKETAELEEKDREAIESLFPVAHYADEGRPPDIYLAYKGGYRNIYHPAHFDTYFRLSINQGLLHESQYQRFLLTDDLDGNDLDQKHWTIFTNPSFLTNAVKCLEMNKYDAGRAAKIVGFCLDLESKFGLQWDECQSLKVAVSIMNTTVGKRKSAEYMDEVLRAIIESGTAVSMPIAAFLAAGIQFSISNRKSTPRPINLMSSYGYRFFEFLNNNELKQYVKRWPQQLRDHLKTPKGKKQGKLSNPVIIRIYANAIPYIYKTDASETSEDEYLAFTTFQQLVPEDQFLIYVTEALTQLSGDTYSMDLPLLRKLIEPEAYQSAFEAWKASYDSPESIPCDPNCLVAYETTIDNPNAPDTISKKTVDAIWNKYKTNK